jgi:hypothetical protein
MKRASYRDGIDFIAQNDGCDEHDAYHLAGFVTVVMLASIFGVTPERVAADVLRRRNKLEKEGQL